MLWKIIYLPLIIGDSLRNVFLSTLITWLNYLNTWICIYLSSFFLFHSHGVGRKSVFLDPGRVLCGFCRYTGIGRICSMPRCLVEYLRGVGRTASRWCWWDWCSDVLNVVIETGVFVMRTWALTKVISCVVWPGLESCFL